MPRPGPREGPRERSPLRRPEIVFLVHDLDATGGAERQLGKLAREIERQGAHVLVVTTTRERWPRRETREGVSIERVPFPEAREWWSYELAQGLYEAVAAWTIRRRARGARVIYGAPAYPTGVQAAKIGDVLGKPAVAKIACSGKAGDFEALGKDPEAEELREVLAKIERVVYLNEDSRGEAERAGIDPGKLREIPNGVDLDGFHERTSEEIPQRDGETVLFVGRLDRQKRVEVLIEAFEKVAGRRPRARLAIVGKGSERDALEAKARERGIEDRVRFLGVRRDVPSLLEEARVFVLPSAEEGQSNALLEALAAGVPVVATDIAGNRAIARDGREAILVPVDDAKALERAIERVLEDPELAKALGRAGRERVERVHAIERVAEKYRELFRELERPRGPRELAFFAFLAIRIERIGRAFAAYAANKIASHADLWARRVVTAIVVTAKRARGAR